MHNYIAIIITALTCQYIGIFFCYSYKLYRYKNDLLTDLIPFGYYVKMFINCAKHLSFGNWKELQ